VGRGGKERKGEESGEGMRAWPSRGSLVVQVSTGVRAPAYGSGCSLSIFTSPPSSPSFSLPLGYAFSVLFYAVQHCESKSE